MGHMTEQRNDASASRRHPSQRRLPGWLKRNLPAGGRIVGTTHAVRSSRLETVCEQARCPNRTACWSRRVVTFLILGKRCTRDCAFCSVEHGAPARPDPDEPRRLAETVRSLGARHVVITSVTRDDLPDEGAGAFAACVGAVREVSDRITVEVLPPDLHARCDCMETICAAGPAVFNHNLETVARLSPTIRPQADYERSLDVLRIVKHLRPSLLTKSGLLLGFGEDEDEIRATLRDLRSVGCDIVTIGQYLQPTSGHWPVARYWRPDEFERVAAFARRLGFASVVAGPFVRSSYRAAEAMDAAGAHEGRRSGGGCA